MHGAEDLSLHLAVEPVRKPPETLMQSLPVFDPIGDGWRRGDAAEAGDVFVTHFAAFPAGLDQAELQPQPGLAEANKHA